MDALWGPRFRLFLAAALLGIVAGTLLFLTLRETTLHTEGLQILLPTPSPMSAVAVVHIVGQVTQPGVYSLPTGTRLFEAVEAAGGATAAADTEAINMALIIRDGQRYDIPPRGEVEGESTPDTVDINAATVAELEALNGIGPTRAQAIIAYRQEHGPFQRIEDLLQVSGIGSSILEQLRDRIVVR